MVPFETLYRSEFRGVWSFLRRLGARASMVDDLTHDVFLTAYQRLHTFDASRPVGPWLRGIAWKIAADHRRLHFHEREIGSEVEASAPQAAPDELLAQKQAQQMLDEALLSLDFEKRTVFVFHDIEGQSVPDIAALIDVPVSTTYSRLRLAREQMSAAVHRIRLRRGIA